MSFAVVPTARRPRGRLSLALLPLLVGIATGCPKPDTADTGPPGETGPDVVDVDQDGYPAEHDCNDRDASINPGAEEICDELDNDCDGVVDEGLQQPWYPDEDDDGYGDAAGGEYHCEGPDGWVEDDSDCDDTRDDVYPEAPESCDGVDNDCDTEVDEDGETVWYEDADGDGYGDADSTLVACNPGDGWVSDAEDCDDDRADVHPDAEEVCDEADNDCDDTVDEEVSTTYWLDADSDGYGAEDDPTEACELPEGYAETASGADCDDDDAAINPAATEVCDEADNDCDGTVDEDDASDAATWYADGDSDDYGDADTSTQACEAPSGYVADSSDCDDGDAAINPGVEELCDGIDNDCDGAVDEDEAVDAATWYLDADADGYGDEDAEDTAQACSQPSGYASSSDDCDDDDAAINPGAGEICDELDNDCDGLVDDDDGSVTGRTMWYGDDDGDDYGDASDSSPACVQPSGFVADNTDCDDSDGEIYPGATEICDEVDNDCDGLVDADDGDVTDASTWYADADSDDFGDPDDSVIDCSQPAGYIADDTDCDDSNADVYPGADEYCDGVDEDCDGVVDDAALDTDTWYEDADADGYGADSGAATTQACSQPSGYADNTDDCDDSDPAINPAASEICDGLDNDCDGLLDDDDPSASGSATWYADSDEDRYGDPATTQEACSQPSGYVLNDDDCDDGDGSISPAADEICDGLDNDCDGLVDDDDAPLVGADTWYHDDDGDGYGDPDSAVDACSQPSGTQSNSYDCDDTDAGINPDADETCDGVDEDCDGDIDDDAVDVTDFYEDTDSDGYGDDGAVEAACSAPTGYVALGGDCDDDDPDVHPGATEVCSGSDADCDGDDPDVCTNCDELLSAGNTSDGLYDIDPDGASGGLTQVEVWCDMSTSGGGWTLVQRTVWDWSDSSLLWDSYADWHDTTVGSAQEGKAFRLAGEAWSSLNLELDHMIVHEARDDADSSDCEPLYYLADSGLLSISATAATVSGIVSDVMIFNGSDLVATDSSSAFAYCSASPYYGVPWFYGGCCNTCPTFKGGSWSDEPHPMADYLDTDADLYGLTTAEACPSGAAEANAGGAGVYEGVNVMEYYLR